MGVLRRVAIGALVGAVFGWGYYLLAGPVTDVLCPSGGLILVLVLAGLTLRLLGLRPAWPTGCLSGVIIIIAGLVVSADAAVGTRFDFAAIGIFAFSYAFAAVLTTGYGADGL
jgi:hypothetical protein